MTTKQDNFVKVRIAKPKATRIEVVTEAGYKVNGIQSASQLYNENMKKPEIQTALAKYNTTIESVLVKNLTEFSDSEDQWKRSMSNDNAKWLHDKIHGKAVQQSTSVNAHFYQHTTEKRKQLGL